MRLFRRYKRRRVAEALVQFGQAAESLAVALEALSATAARAADAQ